MQPDVALVSPYPSAGERHGGFTGVASYSANLAHALADRGADVTVLAPRDGVSPDLAHDGPVRVERPYARGAAALPAAARAALKSRASTVHLQHELFLYGGPASVPGLVPALGALRRAGVGPVVTMHHVVDPAGIDAGFTRLHRVKAPPVVARAGLGGVQAAIRRIARAVVVHEPSFADVVTDAHVVPHGIEIPPATDRAAAREALGLDDRLTILCFGFIAPYKGLEVALSAGRLAGSDVRIVVAGGRHPRLDESGDSYADDLQRQFGAHATFTGHVPDAEVATWFAAVDLALFMYPQPFSASGPLALALAHRTPLLISKQLGACMDAPADLTVDADAHALAARLREHAQDRAALTPLQGAAEQLAHERGWPTVADRHLELYEEVSA
jgi:glycosyltransferase involved in cell wall biosynthesis